MSVLTIQILFILLFWAGLIRELMKDSPILDEFEVFGLFVLSILLFFVIIS